MTLKEQLKQKNEELISSMPQEVVDGLIAGNAEVMAMSPEANALKVGDSIPEVVLPNYDGQQLNLHDLLKDSNLVISFYRGTWCPYCSLELKTLVDSCEEFKAAGGQLVAISPELPDQSMETIEMENIQFPVMSDLGNKIADSFGLTFKMPNNLQEIYKMFEFNLVEKNGDDSWVLPMPATYVVNKEGKIVFSFVNADYTQRAEPADILAVLKNI